MALVTDIIFLIARVLLGGFYLYNAYNHFFNLDFMTEYAKSKDVHPPRVLVMFTGLLLVIAGATFMLGIYPLIGIISLTVFFVPVTYQMHNFWAIDDIQQKQVEKTNFLKNLALWTSALMFLLISTPWPFSLGQFV